MCRAARCTSASRGKNSLAVTTLIEQVHLERSIETFKYDYAAAGLIPTED